jgi:hypothetical protein
MENVLEKDITGHMVLKSICVLLLGGTANLWTNPGVDGKTLALILFYTLAS